jgi:nucleotide-binding universal stress UspA family protein
VHDDTALKHFKRYVPKGVINDYLRELCSQDLQKAQKQLDADNVAHDMIIEFGNIAETIADVARKGSFDLIVLGAKGRTMIKEIVMGSVAMHVIALATIPVTLVR